MAYDRAHDVARIPLTVKRGDTALARFRTRLGLSSHTASTIVMNYDQAHSQVINRYRISTEPPAKPDFELNFECQHLRWSV